MNELPGLLHITALSHYDDITLQSSCQTSNSACSWQAQRARSTLAVQVLGSMRAAGIDAFLANTTTELAMCNLVGIPTVSVPIGYGNVSSSLGNSNRKEPITVGIFGWPNGEPEVSCSNLSDTRWLLFMSTQKASLNGLCDQIHVEFLRSSSRLENCTQLVLLMWGSQQAILLAYRSCSCGDLSS